MSNLAIRVERIGKRYQIGAARARYQTLRDAISAAVSRPFRRARMTAPALGRGTVAGRDPFFWALKDVSFELGHGQALGVIGRNGAGKSTLLKILSRITEPTEGFAEIHGSVRSLLEVGSGFHGELTGRENIFLNGAILGMPKAEIERKFDEIVDFAEVEKFIDTPVKHYSSGMYVRLAFSVAAHLEPEILIVDEVLAVGDVAFQRKCLGKMDTVAKAGRTVLFVSHNMAAVQSFCDSGLLLKDGAVAFSGSIGEAVEKYLSLNLREDYGFADLSAHPGRAVNDHPILRSLGLRGDGPGYARSIKTGDEVTFEIKFDSGDVSFDYVVLGINSAAGERVCSVGTHLSPAFHASMRGIGTLECRIPALPLAEGEYTVVIAAGVMSPRRDLDRVENALSFHADSGNYFGTGRSLLKGQGHLAQRSEWRVTEAAGRSGHRAAGPVTPTAR